MPEQRSFRQLAFGPKQNKYSEKRASNDDKKLPVQPSAHEAPPVSTSMNKSAAAPPK